MNRVVSLVAAALVAGFFGAGCGQGQGKPLDAYSDDALLASKPAGTNAVIVHATGYGTGSITISDPSARCQVFEPDYSHYTQVCWAYVPVPATASVSVDVAATNGSRFIGWGAGPCGGTTAGTCAVAMDRDRILSAGFDPGGTGGTPGTYTLSVDVLGFVDGDISAPPDLGLACAPSPLNGRVRTCSASVPVTDPPAQVTLNATATGGGTQFGGWGGSCSGVGTCTVTMDRDRGVTASFVNVGVQVTRACTVPHGTGTETWTAGAYGPCVATGCDTGFALYEGACMPSSQPCTVANGTGTQAWEGTGYGACSAASCDAGFALAGGACVLPASACGDLVDGAILSEWSWYASDSAATTLSVLAAPDVVRGQSALRAVTQAGYDFALIWTAPAGMRVDATGAQFLRLSVRGTNTTPNKWQVASPVVVLQDASGNRRQYAPAVNLLNSDGASWIGVAVPLAGDALWGVSGAAVDLSALTRIELHTDTWDFGFTLDVDALSFDQAGAVCAIASASSCGSGYASYQGACIPSALTCPVANGVGQQTWNGSGYGACAAVACSAGYVLSAGRCVVAVAGDGTAANPYTSTPPLPSCLAYLGAGYSRGDGGYVLSLGTKPATVYCDMTGGGTTYEAFGFGPYVASFPGYASIGGPDFAASAALDAAFSFHYGRLGGIPNLAVGWNSNNCCIINPGTWAPGYNPSTHASTWYGFAGSSLLFPAYFGGGAINCNGTYWEPTIKLLGSGQSTAFSSITPGQVGTIAYSGACSVDSNPAIFVKRYR